MNAQEFASLSGLNVDVRLYDQLAYRYFKVRDDGMLALRTTDMRPLGLDNVPLSDQFLASQVDTRPTQVAIACIVIAAHYDERLWTVKETMQRAAQHIREVLDTRRRLVDEAIRNEPPEVSEFDIGALFAAPKEGT